MVFINHVPTSFLAQHLNSIIYFKGYQPDHSIQRVVPDGFVYLIFELDAMPRYVIDNDTLAKKSRKTRAWISGLHKDYITISALPDSEMYVFQFKAHGLYPFVKVPVDSLTNQVASPDEYFGTQIFDFRKALLEAASPGDKIILGEHWLESRFSAGHTVRPEVLQVHDTIRSQTSLELNSITELIDATGLSKKHFTALFKKYIGLTPKQFQRVVRFNEILLRINEQQSVDWPQIALSCGFYDQAHFIKEFKQFCGMNPGEFISNYKDYEANNFFPLD